LNAANAKEEGLYEWLWTQIKFVQLGRKELFSFLNS